MAQVQQKKIEELTTMSKNLIDKMTGAPQHMNGSKTGNKLHKQGGGKWCNHYKSWVYHNSDKYYALEKNKQHRPQWYNNLMNSMETKNDEERGPNSTV